ncbi:MAG TPA: isochorismatase family protein [Edaphobacter sp.]|nr:isochorismatase family protein [Edaphobacter sp.]HMF64039.1 isochorismatase family protein [Edaphobacter sp.]
MSSLQLNPKTTALVLIDLQHGVVARPTAPYPAGEVVEISRRLAEGFRAKGATVVYVRVDINNFRQLPADEMMLDPSAPPPPAIASELVPEAGFQDGDLLITKRHWGAFAGTVLEEELKKRGVETVVLGGIATNMGVESTARQGTGLGFAFVIVEDACTSLDADAHRFAFTKIFPRLARVRKTDEVLAAIG